LAIDKVDHPNPNSLSAPTQGPFTDTGLNVSKPHLGNSWAFLWNLSDPETQTAPQFAGLFVDQSS
jgi:hypothetical protein